MDKEIKVVDIISEYRVVLNCGTEDGIHKGALFLVYGLGKFLEDPDTKEPLEQVEIIRGSGRVIHVQKTICTIESIEKSGTPVKTRRFIGRDPVLYMTPIEETERREMLPFEEVQVGDRAKKLS